MNLEPPPLKKLFHEHFLEVTSKNTILTHLLKRQTHLTDYRKRLRVWYEAHIIEAEIRERELEKEREKGV